MDCWHSWPGPRIRLVETRNDVRHSAATAAVSYRRNSQGGHGVGVWLRLFTYPDGALVVNAWRTSPDTLPDVLYERWVPLIGRATQGWRIDHLRAVAPGPRACQSQAT